MDFDAIKRVLTAFEREGVRYAIFGAAALDLHGLARSAEDLDVFLELWRLGRGSQIGRTIFALPSKRACFAPEVGLFSRRGQRSLHQRQVDRSSGRSPHGDAQRLVNRYE